MDRNILHRHQPYRATQGEKHKVSRGAPDGHTAPFLCPSAAPTSNVPCGCQGRHIYAPNHINIQHYLQAAPVRHTLASKPHSCKNSYPGTILHILAPQRHQHKTAMTAASRTHPHAWQRHSTERTPALQQQPAPHTFLHPMTGATTIPIPLCRCSVSPLHNQHAHSLSLLTVAQTIQELLTESISSSITVAVTVPVTVTVISHRCVSAST